MQLEYGAEIGRAMVNFDGPPVVSRYHGGAFVVFSGVLNDNMEVAEKFEQVHNIERARAVGSVDAIISARDPRPYLVGAVQRGMSRARP